MAVAKVPNHVDGTIGGENIGQQAAQCQPRRGGREQEGQHGQRLPQADLNRSEGELKDVAEVAQDEVDGGHHRGQGELLDVGFAHV